MSVGIETIGHAVVLTIDRPKAKNAIDRDVATRLGEGIRAASADPAVRGIVITAAGSDVFVSGGDLKEIDALTREGGGPEEILRLLAELSEIEAAPVPVIAAVQGATFGGGCELLLMCDLVILERHAALAFRHARMGLSPAWGGATRLLERVGPLEAARLLFTGDTIGAEEAALLGLASEVVEHGASRDRALALVERIAENPRATIAAIKRALRVAQQARRADSLEREQAAFAETWGGPDHRAALQAFFARK